MKYTVSAPGEPDSSANSPRKGPIVNISAGMSGRLVLVIVLLSAAVVALAVAMLVLTSTRLSGVARYHQEEGYTCQTDECVISAARIIKSLDTTADPCEDFYQFACGGWIENNPMPEEYSQWDQFRALRENLLHTIREILDDKDTALTPKPLSQARSLYKTCLDQDALEKLGVAPLLKIIRSIGLPEVPFGPESPQAALDTVPAPWLNVVTKTQRNLGASVLFNLYVAEHPRNTSKNVISLDQASPGFSERYLLDPTRFSKEVKLYEEYVKDMIELLVTNVPGAKINASAVAQEVVEFSKMLAHVTTPVEERRDLHSQAQEMSINDLQNISDSKLDFSKNNPSRLDWAQYMREVFHGVNVTIDLDNDLVIVMDTKYFQKLAELLQKTSPETIDRYLWWRIFSSLAPLTLKQFRDLASDLAQKVMGHSAQTPRWRSCASSVNANFGMAISFEYVKRHFHEDARQKALEMVNDIHVAFEEMVHNLDWMDDSTKNRTLEKAHAIRPFVGFPEWLLYPGELERYYHGMEVVDGELFSTYVGLASNAAKRMLEELAHQPDRNKFISSPTTVNAFYSPVLNSITFPAGLLHPPFYGLGLEALNYGAIGAIMGHELTHGFDDQGRQYDLHGNLKQWWSNETLHEYNHRVQCIIDQYGKYHVQSLGSNFTVNGVNTQGENIADNGGLREAQRAYGYLKARQIRLARTRKGLADLEPSLPGLSHFSHKQLFYLGFAHMWCGTSTLGALKSTVVDGVHSPNRFRVVGTLSNMQEFSEAWHCPAGSPMNPHNKCILW
ncbi:neprilysin-4-like isoform X2 [Neocloeon triangulifer]|uniref:neprilysin-4-like isoform X2 n=1 Tax=Neocloeon triangulifer TaxID=2078957 RepID=UPI00286F8F1A|nr:neprilysin-4-like isoform X2 [Neocloeon triangulifer]